MKTNTGYRNSGYRNSGDCNSGDFNSGNYNSGDYNSGNYNSGDCNSGSFNSGDCNSGSFNSGDYNSGYRNSGSFNINEPKMRLFNKELDMTVSEFKSKYSLYMNISLNTWIDESNMTDAEKDSNEGWEEVGGYLKTIEYKDVCRKWWEENPEEHERFLTLPGFDSEIFEEITGIDVDKPEEMIEIDGKKWSKSTIKEALKVHAK